MFVTVAGKSQPIKCLTLDEVFSGQPEGRLIQVQDPPGGVFDVGGHREVEHVVDGVAEGPVAVDGQHPVPPGGLVPVVPCRTQRGWVKTRPLRLNAGKVACAEGYCKLTAARDGFGIISCEGHWS